MYLKTNVKWHFLIDFFLPIDAKANLRRQHHPYGTPQVVQADATFCLLHHSDYLSGYSKNRLMPLWVSYTVQPLVSPLLGVVFHL